MRLSRSLLLIAVLVALAPWTAAPYARLVAPFHALAGAIVGRYAGWEVVKTAVEDTPGQHGRALALTADLYRRPSDRTAAARVVGRVTVGGVVEGPLVYLGLLALWPVRDWRERARLLCLALPGLAVIELLTTLPELLHTLPSVVGEIAGLPQAYTPWDRWTELLSGGGRFAIEVSAALLAIAVIRPAGRRR